MNISGIYQIRSKIKSNKFYIGSAVNISARWNRHITVLRLSKHENQKLQRHYNKYGEQDLQFSILLICDKKDLIKIEQYFIDFYNPIFNICKIAGSQLGIKRSEKTKAKMRGRPVSDETRKKLSNALKNNKNGFGKHPSDEIRQKLREIHLGEKNHMYGKHLTEETKKKMKDTVKKKNNHN